MIGISHLFNLTQRVNLVAKVKFSFRNLKSPFFHSSYLASAQPERHMQPRIISLGLIGIIIKNRKEENNGKGFGRKEI
jgi:hypothetical protein